MRYLPEHRATFIHNPKTAGTSISTWLDENFVTKRGRKHGHIDEVNEYFPQTTFAFGVVRNPWQRLASWYVYSNHNGQNFKDWLLQRVQTNKNVLSFHSNIMWSRNWYSLDTPQHRWFGPHTKILKFETLEDDFVEIQQKLNCYKSLTVENKNYDYSYKDLYTNELVEYVRDIFIKDVIEYGYEY